MPLAPVSAVLLGDPLGDGSLWSYLVRSDGVSVEPPALVHGPAPRGGEIAVSILSSSLLLTQTQAADGARTHALVDVSGAMPSEPAPVVLAPAPTGHVVQIEALADDVLVFAAADAFGAAAGLWDTSYVGTTVAAPQQLSSDEPGHGYTAFATAPADDAVLGLRTELATGIDNLVWMPRAPADPDAAAVVTAFDQDWQQITQLGFLADAEHVWFTGTTESADVEDLFVDDLDPGTAPVRVNPPLAAEDQLHDLRLSPDRSTFLFWAGANAMGGGTQGDVFMVSVADGVVGAPVDLTPGDRTAHWDVSVSSQWGWVAYRVGDTPDAIHVEIVGIAGGVAGAPLVLAEVHSLTNLAFAVDDAAVFTIGDDGVLRRAGLGAELGPAETVTDVLAVGLPRPSPSGAWLAVMGAGVESGYSHHAIDLGGALPGTTLRIDVPPEPGAEVSTQLGFTPDESYAYYTEFLDPGTPRALRATRLVEGGATLLLGHTFLDYGFLPPP
ncbi:MAG: hypothetical protein K1X88_27365 [Nannocystaceae bacterium]|nr:hypothetical protein [Nannocystaceae bacterium]